MCMMQVKGWTRGWWLLGPSRVCLYRPFRPPLPSILSWAPGWREQEENAWRVDGMEKGMPRVGEQRGPGQRVSLKASDERSSASSRAARVLVGSGYVAGIRLLGHPAPGLNLPSPVPEDKDPSPQRSDGSSSGPRAPQPPQNSCLLASMSWVLLRALLLHQCCASLHQHGRAE